MSQDLHQRKHGKASSCTVGELITDPAELERLDARRPPDDGGVERMVGAVLEIAQDREARGKPVDLVGAALAFVGLLTPEQQRVLVRGLPEEARREMEALLRPTC